MYKKIFAGVLKEARLAKNISQEKLGELSNLDPVTIYRYENGIQEPTLKNLFFLCKGLEMEVSEFVNKLVSNGYPGPIVKGLG